MRGVKKTSAYYWEGWRAGKASIDKSLPPTNGMARRLYLDGYKNAKEGKATR